MAEAAAQDDYRAHLDTYSAFSRLVTFMILWIVLLLSSMALGLIGHVSIIALLLGIGGTLALIIGFTVFG